MTQLTVLFAIGLILLAVGASGCAVKPKKIIEPKPEHIPQTIMYAKV